MEPEDQAIPTDDGSSPAPPSMGADQSQQGIPDTQSPEQVYGPGPVNNPVARAGAAVGQGLSNFVNAGRDMQQPPPANPNPDEQPGGRPFPGTQMITSLLMGKGAKDPTEAQQRVDQFKAQGANDDQANLLATVMGSEHGGQAGMADTWEMMQYQRGAFNAKQSFAAAAFNGTDGKPADINAAATAATQASAHIVDGSSASFHVDGRGVTATVTDPAGKKTSYDMTAQQFGQYLDVGKTSQFDRLMQTGGVAGAMQAVGAKPSGAPQDAGDEASTGTPSSDKDQSQVPQGGEAGKGNKVGYKADEADEDADTSPQPNDYGPGKDAYGRPDDGKFRLPSPLPPGGSRAALRMGDEYRHALVRGQAPAPLHARPSYGDEGEIPGAFDKMGHYKGPNQNSGTNYGPEEEARADARFGKGNVAANPQKQEWLAKNAEAAAQRKSTMDVEIQKGKNLDQRAAITGQWHQGLADSNNATKKDIAADNNTTKKGIASGYQGNKAKELQLKQDRLTLDTASRERGERGKMIGRILMSKPDASVDEVNSTLASFNIPPVQSSVAPTVRGNPAQGGQGQDQSGDTSQAAQGKKLYNGQWYTKEEYHRHVLGED